MSYISISQFLKPIAEQLRPILGRGNSVPTNKEGAVDYDELRRRLNKHPGGALLKKLTELIQLATPNQGNSQGSAKDELVSAIESDANLKFLRRTNTKEYLSKNGMQSLDPQTQGADGRFLDCLVSNDSTFGGKAGKFILIKFEEETIGHPTKETMTICFQPNDGSKATEARSTEIKDSDLSLSRLYIQLQKKFADFLDWQ